MSEQPKDSREFSADIELSTGLLIPGGKIALGFKRSYEKRADRIATKALRAAGVTQEEFADRLAVGDEFADVTKQAFTQALESGDEYYQDAMTAFIVAALRNDDRIDTISYTLGKIEALSALQVKIIGRFPLVPTIPFYQLENLLEKNIGYGRGPVTREEVELQLSSMSANKKEKWSAFAWESELATLMRADRRIAYIALNDLSGTDFMDGTGSTSHGGPKLDLGKNVPPIDFPTVGGDEIWILDELGKIARAIIRGAFEEDEAQQSYGRGDPPSSPNP